MVPTSRATTLPLVLFQICLRRRLGLATGWRELLVTLRQERMMEQLKEENLRYKAKSDEPMRRTMSMMVRDQAGLVVGDAFSG